MRSYSKIYLCAGLLLLVFCGYQLLNLYRDSSYNSAIHSGNYESAAGHGSEYGRFAGAREIRLGEEYARAQQAYAAVDIEKAPKLRGPVMFELAQTYVGQAVGFEKAGEADQRIPLLELAKENYRKILVDEPDNWAVRVNLARVLRMLPDARLLADDDEDVMPERSPQAPVQTMGHDRLP